jgi:DNA processing protein
MVIPEDRSIYDLTVKELLGRPLNDVEQKSAPDMLHIKGSMETPLLSPRVSIVGSRKASTEGLEHSKMITKALTRKDVVIVSGLAEGIDTSAHIAAMEEGGKTIAVLGTPLNKTYPKKNFNLQQEIMRNHLAISQFQIGQPTRPKDFVLRNRTMALISDVTIIVEATDESGSRHQGWEALRLGRPLFIWKLNFNKPEVNWPKDMVKYGAIELSHPEDVLESLPSSRLPEMLNLLS